MSVSLGMRALLLIRLGARQGQWVGVETLAETHRITQQTVREGLQELLDEGYVRCRTGADGMIEAAMSAVGV